MSNTTVSVDKEVRDNFKSLYKVSPSVFCNISLQLAVNDMQFFESVVYTTAISNSMCKELMPELSSSAKICKEVSK